MNGQEMWYAFRAIFVVAVLLAAVSGIITTAVFLTNGEKGAIGEKCKDDGTCLGGLVCQVNKYPVTPNRNTYSCVLPESK